MLNASPGLSLGFESLFLSVVGATKKLSTFLERTNERTNQSPLGQATSSKQVTQKSQKHKSHLFPVVVVEEEEELSNALGKIQRAQLQPRQSVAWLHAVDEGGVGLLPRLLRLRLATVVVMDGSG